MWGSCCLLVEVVVSRPASVFVRELMPDEAVKLRRISRQSKVFALRQRAQIVLASDAGSSAPEIARVLQSDENQVRRVIRDFNADGMVTSMRSIARDTPSTGSASRVGPTTGFEPSSSHIVLAQGGPSAAERRLSTPAHRWVEA
jgi:Winged helix-turn helix